MIPDELLNTTLTPAELKDIAEAESALAKIAPLIERLESCGVNCDERKAQSAMLIEYFDNIKREFSPSIIE